MSLIPIDLPVPAELNHHWAALGALYAAQGYRDTGARDRMRFFSDGGGNWMRLALLPGGRALLFGWEREGRTILREREVHLQQLDVGLLTGAPDWWAEALDRSRQGIQDGLIGFIYGWEDGGWRRAPYRVDDGFRLFPKLDHVDTVEFISTWISDSDAESPIFDEDYNVHEAGRRAIAALVAAGPEVTTEQLAAVFPEDWDLTAGVATAREFRLPPG